MGICGFTAVPSSSMRLMCIVWSPLSSGVMQTRIARAQEGWRTGNSRAARAIEGSDHRHFTLVVGSVVTECGDLKIHKRASYVPAQPPEVQPFFQRLPRSKAKARNPPPLRKRLPRPRDKSSTNRPPLGSPPPFYPQSDSPSWLTFEGSRT